MKKLIIYIIFTIHGAIYSKNCNNNIYKVKRSIILNNPYHSTNLISYLVIIDPNGDGNIKNSDINSNLFENLLTEIETVYNDMSQKSIEELDYIINLWYKLMENKVETAYKYSYLKSIYENPDAKTDDIEDIGNMFAPEQLIFTIYRADKSLISINYLNTHAIVNIAFEILMQKKAENNFFSSKIKTTNDSKIISINQLLQSSFKPYQNIINFKN